MFVLHMVVQNVLGLEAFAAHVALISAVVALSVCRIFKLCFALEAKLVNVGDFNVVNERHVIS
jgi:hypothetical protein